MTTYREAAEAIVADVDPALGIVRVARYALLVETPDRDETVAVTEEANEVIRAEDAPPQHQDAAVLALARASREMLPFTEQNRKDVGSVASQVLREPGWSHEAKQLAGAALSDVQPDHHTSRTIAEIAGRVLTHREVGPSGVPSAFADIDSAEVELLAVAAMSRVVGE